MKRQRSQVRMPERATNSKRRAQVIMDDLFANLVVEHRDEVNRCEAALLNAKRYLTEMQAQQLAWQRDGTFDHVLGVRALLMAQIADLDQRTHPAGANLTDMMEFLTEHHPPVKPS